MACGPWLRVHEVRRARGGDTGCGGERAADLFRSFKFSFQIETNLNRPSAAYRRAAAALGAEPARSSGVRIAKHLRQHRAHRNGHDQSLCLPSQAR